MAGRYWLLSERRILKENQVAAVIEFSSSCHHDSYNIFRKIKFRGDVDKLESEYARQILYDLQTDIQELYGFTVNLKKEAGDFDDNQAEPSGVQIWLNRLGCFSVIGLLLTIFGVGLVVSIRWLMGIF